MPPLNSLSNLDIIICAAFFTGLFTGLANFIVNNHLNSRKNREVKLRSQKQVYSQLRGRAETMCQIYSSLGQDFVQISIYKTIWDYYNLMEPLSRSHRSGVESQSNNEIVGSEHPHIDHIINQRDEDIRKEMYNDYLRHLKSSDNLIVEAAKSKGFLFESIGQVLFLFDNNQIDKRIEIIEQNINYIKPNLPMI